jgi:hypothetical protein
VLRLRDVGKDTAVANPLSQSHSSLVWASRVSIMSADVNMGLVYKVPTWPEHGCLRPVPGPCPPRVNIRRVFLRGTKTEHACVLQRVIEVAGMRLNALRMLSW